MTHQILFFTFLNILKTSDVEFSFNKNDNIHKSEAHEKSDNQTNIDNIENITEYNIIPKLIFLRIIIPKFMNIRQLLHVKDVCIYVKNNMFKWKY